MSVMMSEEQFAKKRVLFTVFGIILVIIGFGLFITGPILAFITRIYPLFVLSFAGIFFLFPGTVLVSLGTHRSFAAFAAQSVGPVAVESSQKYGKKVAKEMARGVKEGFFEEDNQIYCKYCGQEIDEDSEFCKYCGKKLN